jgi:hypothetical protein
MSIKSNFNIKSGINTATVSNIIGANITNDVTTSVSDLSHDGTHLTFSNKTSNGSLILKTNNTAAITINSSGNVTFAGTLTGYGSGLTSLNASNFSSGTIPAAQLGSGTPSSTTYLRGDSTWATITSGATITDDTTTNATRYLLFDDITSGASTSIGVSSTKLTYNPSTGFLTSGGLTITASTSNALVVNGSALSSDTSVVINGATSKNRVLFFQTAGVNRWVFNTNNTAESGSNAGSDLFIGRYSDAGAYLATSVSINRSTGLTSLESLAVTGTSTLSDNITVNKASGTAQLTLNTATANNRYVQFNTNAVARWLIGASGSAETGSDAGSNFFIARYSDAGANTGYPLQIDRSTGIIALENGITLNNATSNLINFNTAGTAVPSFTTRSAGTKIVWYSALNSSNSDYATGISNLTLWNSVPNTGSQFQWYGGTTLAATLSGTGNFTITGNAQAVNFISTSDITKKTNIEPITNALDTVEALQGKTFDFIDSGEHSMGFIAQEVEELLPYLVHEKDDGTKGVNYPAMVALMAEAIKELNAKVDSLMTNSGRVGA